MKYRKKILKPSLYTHHIGLKILFGVLANHNSKLAADIAMELSRAQTVLPGLMREDYAPYVHTELQKWIDQLSAKDRPNG